MCAAVQTLNVARSGEEPDIVAAVEDTRLLFGPSAMKRERAGAFGGGGVWGWRWFWWRWTKCNYYNSWRWWNWRSKYN